MSELDKAKEKAAKAAANLEAVKRSGKDDRKAQSNWAAAELEVLKIKKSQK